MNTHVKSNRIRFVTVLQYCVYGSVILYFGQPLFVPLAFALLISFVLFPICFYFEKKGLGRVTSISIAMGLSGLLFAGIATLLVTQLTRFLKEWPSLKEKLVTSVADLYRYLNMVVGIPEDQLDRWTHQLVDGGTNLNQLIQHVFIASSVSILMMVLIPVYVALILYHRKLWLRVLYKAIPEVSKHRIQAILGLTIKAYHNFIKGVALVYLIVGILNSIGLLVLGIPHAFLFGFIASVLTFIPYVGIVVGSLLPISMAWITYDSVWYPVGVVAIFSIVQYLEANVIFPLAVSRRLNVNTLVVLIAIFSGGIVWGVAGMILFVPFIGILKLIADHNPRWSGLSMVLGHEKEPL